MGNDYGLSPPELIDLYARGEGATPSKPDDPATSLPAAASSTSRGSAYVPAPTTKSASDDAPPPPPPSAPATAPVEGKLSRTASEPELEAVGAVAPSPPATSPSLDASPNLGQSPVYSLRGVR